MKEKLSFRKEYIGRTIFHICNLVFMVLVILLMIIPILKVLSDSFDRAQTYGLNFFPKEPSVMAYKIIFSKEALYLPFVISIITTISGTILGLVLTTLGAYVLARRDLLGREIMAMFVFITMVFRGGIIPLFLVVKGLGLTNTLLSVLLPTAIQVYFMILMRNFFEQIPKSLFESAEMDGASPMQTFIRLAIPLSKAGLAAIGLFYAVQYWNSFFEYIMYITNPKLFNFQIKVRELILIEQVMDDPGILGYGNMLKNAAVIVAMLPFLFIYPFAQRYFITGVTLGAIKE